MVNSLGLAKVGKTLARGVQGANAMWLARRALLAERWALCVTNQSLLEGLRSVASESRGNLAAVVCRLVIYPTWSFFQGASASGDVECGV